MKIHSFYMRKRHECGEQVEYDEDNDAYFCRACNAWTEAKCSDTNCSYCSKRPVRPLPYLELVK
jgi:hypothetical protein